MPHNDQRQTVNPPMISVIIPAYNTADHICAAVESVFAQTFRDFELIVVDDGSPDHERMEQALALYLSRIIYLRQANLGPSAARNLAIKRAQGMFLAFLDSDDTWFPDYLSQQIKLLQSDPSLDMVYCDALLVGAAQSGKTFMELCPSNGPVTFESLLTEKTQVITSGTVVRRETVVAAGLFDERLRRAEDHDLWLRIAYRGGKLAYQRKVLVRRLVRADSLGSVPGSLVAGEIEVLEKLRKEFALGPDANALLLGKLQRAEALLATIQGKRSLLAGNSQEAYNSLSQAYRSLPTWKLRVVLAALRTMPRVTLWGTRMWYRLGRSGRNPSELLENVAPERQEQTER